MTTENSVIKALRSSLEANPDDRALALHLAQLLLDQDNGAEEALALYQRLLVSTPTDTEVLQGALRSAQALDNHSLISAYQTLLKALSDTAKPQPSATALQTQADDDNRNESKKPTRVRGAKLKLVHDGEKLDSNWDLEESSVYLSDVGGMESVKRRLELSFLGPLRNPELMKAYGKKVSGGLLLYGPPGCGKTFIARALAGELGAKFIAVGLADVLDMYIGESERKLHELFQFARRSAPCILFFDELDAIGQKRSHLRHSGMRSLVNQLLAELDGIGETNDSVYILGATNHPWDVDPALRRPGRFDRMVAVLPPDLAARAAILNYHLKDKPAQAIDINELADATALLSGADLAHLCDSAVEYALQESLASGQVRTLTMDDFRQPLAEVKPSTPAWFENARNYALFANDSGAFDELLDYINQHKL